MGATDRMLPRSLAFLAVALLLTLAAGCDVDTPDSVSRTVDIRVGGIYTPPEGREFIVSRNTGSTIRQLNLRQSGDQLEAVDNNGQIFRGTLGSVQEASASFTLRGQTTDGNEGVMSGAITVEGAEATMRGTWIEDDLFGEILAESTGQSVIVDEGDESNGDPDDGDGDTGDDNGNDGDDNGEGEDSGDGNGGDEEDTAEDDSGTGSDSGSGSITSTFPPTP